MSILVISCREDIHADAVILELSARSLSDAVIRLNTEDISSNSIFGFRYSDLWHGSIKILDSAKTTNLSEIQAVWYRKPKPVVPHAELDFEPSRMFAMQEYGAFLRSLYGLLNKAFWVSDYWAIQRASHKLPNLVLANQLGLRTPRTLVTNDPHEADEFAKAADWQLIVKSFEGTNFETEDTAGYWSTFASRPHRELLMRNLESVKYVPTFFQEYIEKDVELRVTIVGRKVFAVAIDSQAHSMAIHDWRAVNVDQLKHTKFDLPMAISDKLISFNRHYGLEFSTLI